MIMEVVTTDEKNLINAIDGVEGVTYVSLLTHEGEVRL